MLYFLLGILILLWFYYKYVKPFKYWEEKGILHEKSWPLVGSMGKIIFKGNHLLELFNDIYNKHPNERYVGFMQFGTPTVMVRDPELIKQLGVKDFDSFPDHLGFVKSDSDPLMSKTLFSMKGNEWRRMRATLSPAFTSSKMKMMFELIEECAKNFVEHFETNRNEAIDMKDVFSRYTNDVIATTSFGIKTDSLNEPNNEFYLMGKNFTTFTLYRKFLIFFISFAPKITLLLKIQIFPPVVCNFFRTLVTETIAKREAAGIIRPDLIHLLMEANKGKLQHDVKQEIETGFATAEESEIGKDKNLMMARLTEDEMVAQALIFFFAGFDTSSTVSCYLAYELALNPGIQKRLQEEIDETANKGKLTYSDLLSLKYFDQVISESMRKWPPGYQTDRVCERDYVIPAKKLGEKSFVIEKGISISIPIMGIHRDPQYYPDPERMDPERFSDENKSKILSGTYMPFGIGPRNCIGSRFALLEIKTLFFHLLRKFDIVVVEKTATRLKFSSKEFNLMPDNGFWLGLKLRSANKA